MCSWRSTAGLFTEISETAYIHSECQGSMSIAPEDFENANRIISKRFEYSWNVCIGDEERT